MSTTVETVHSKIPVFKADNYPTWRVRILATIKEKSKGCRVMTENAPEIIPLGANPTAQQRREAERSEELALKWELAEDAAVSTLFAATQSNQPATNALINANSGIDGAGGGTHCSTDAGSLGPGICPSHSETETSQSERAGEPPN